MYLMSDKKLIDFALVFLYLGIYPKEIIRVPHTHRLCAKIFMHSIICKWTVKQNVNVKY